MKPKIAYNKDTVLLEKYEYFFGEELVLNDNEFQALLDVAIEIERSHAGMDEETFKAKMTKFCEGITNGMIKKAIVDGLTDYLKK